MVYFTALVSDMQGERRAEFAPVVPVVDVEEGLIGSASRLLLVLNNGEKNGGLQQVLPRMPESLTTRRTVQAPTRWLNRDVLSAKSAFVVTDVQTCPRRDVRTTISASLCLSTTISRRSTVATRNAHLDHEHCIEMTILGGRTDAVRECAESGIAQPGVSHGNLHLHLVPMVAQQSHGHAQIEPALAHLGPSVDTGRASGPPRESARPTCTIRQRIPTP